MSTEPEPQDIEVNTAQLTVTVTAGRVQINKFKVLLMMIDPNGGASQISNVGEPTPNHANSVILNFTTQLPAGMTLRADINVYEDPWAIWEQVDLKTPKKDLSLHLRLLDPK